LTILYLKFFFPWYPGGNWRVSQEFFLTVGIWENRVPAGVGVLFSEMAHQFLHSVSVPPNTLQILLEVFMEFGSIGPQSLELHWRMCSMWEHQHKHCLNIGGVCNLHPKIILLDNPLMRRMIYDLPAWRFSSIFEPILQPVTEVNYEGQQSVLEESVQFQLLQNVFGYSSIILICLPFSLFSILLTLLSTSNALCSSLTTN